MDTNSNSNIEQFKKTVFYFFIFYLINNLVVLVSTFSIAHIDKTLKLFFDLQKEISFQIVLLIIPSLIMATILNNIDNKIIKYFFFGVLTIIYISIIIFVQGILNSTSSPPV